ncbi:hypothetical protein J6590_042057 [Homalodisca vitripennis]|nr:hypothetical protein J6590_042051 [Homalodisca vitripennis]KAG8336540.1 hypothetical protein J6590_042057 [Homalodisca vitripennis]
MTATCLPSSPSRVALCTLSNPLNSGSPRPDPNKRHKTSICGAEGTRVHCQNGANQRLVGQVPPIVNTHVNVTAGDNVALVGCAVIDDRMQLCMCSGLTQIPGQRPLMEEEIHSIFCPHRLPSRKIDSRFHVRLGGYPATSACTIFAAANRGQQGITALQAGVETTGKVSQPFIRTGCRSKQTRRWDS